MTSVAGAYAMAMSPSIAKNIVEFQRLLFNFVDTYHMIMWSVVAIYSDELPSEKEWNIWIDDLFKLERSLRRETGEKPDSVHYNSYVALKEEFRDNLKSAFLLAREVQEKVRESGTSDRLKRSTDTTSLAAETDNLNLTKKAHKSRLVSHRSIFTSGSQNC